MFLVDTSPSMGKTREVEIPGTNGGDPEVIEMTNLEWSLQYVMLKIQEMVRDAQLQRCPPLLTREQIYHGRKTEQCGVILFGSEGKPARFSSFCIT